MRPYYPPETGRPRTVRGVKSKPQIHLHYKRQRYSENGADVSHTADPLMPPGTTGRGPKARAHDTPF